jgi:hypothetical protein
MKNKNKSFDCRGNEEADNLLCLLEANSVLSNEFTSKVRNIILVILTNLDKNEDWVEEQIKKLKEEMEWLTIFSDKFTERLISMLLMCFHTQMKLNKQ